ncbi:hypothetical protein [Paenibacillus sp. Z6-24]
MIGLVLVLGACSNKTDDTSAAAGAPAETASNTETAADTKPETTNLKITTFNPGDSSVFAVASNLIEGPTEVVLVDAQFKKMMLRSWYK